MYHEFEETVPQEALSEEAFLQTFEQWLAQNSSWLTLVLVAAFFIWLILIFLVIAGTWKIFEKANKPGWAAIVPFYSTYVFVEVIKRPQWMFWLWLGLYFIYMIAPFVVDFLPLAGLFVLNVIWMIDLAKAFGKGAGFAVANIFVPFISYPILGFSKKIKYVDDETKDSDQLPVQ